MPKTFFSVKAGIVCTQPVSIFLHVWVMTCLFNHFIEGHVSLRVVTFLLTKQIAVCYKVMAILR